MSINSGCLEHSLSVRRMILRPGQIPQESVICENREKRKRWYLVWGLPLVMIRNGLAVSPSQKVLERVWKS